MQPAGQDNAEMTAADRYAERWRKGQAAVDMAAFVGSLPDLDARELGDVLLVDQAFRWCRGTGPSVEEYLAAWPAAAADPEVRLDLVYGEVRARIDRGEIPDQAELVSRFPDLEGPLSRQIDDARSLRSTASPASETILLDDADRRFGQQASAHPSDEPDPRAPLVFSDFELREMLGAGGMGEVHLAQQKSLGKRVAVKVLKRHALDDEGLIERFLREGRAAAALNHPNVVGVHGIGRCDDGRYFLVMDYVEGSSLDRQIRKGPLEPEEAARAVADAASAIAHAHEHGIVHRDLKPSNVLVDREGRVRVTDFGLAKVASHVHTDVSVPGQIIGTPQFMSPEQADPKRWGEVGPATDVYGLGGVLYALLTGRPPADGETLTQVLVQINSADLPEPPRTVRPEVPEALEAICLKCLAKDPRDRYDSAQQVAEALRDWCDVEHAVGPVVAAPSPPRAPRRVRFWSAATAALVIAALAAGLATWWLIPRIDPSATQITWSVEVYPQGQTDSPRELLEQAQPLRNGDRLRIRMDFDQPVYAYAVWIDSEGATRQLHPEAAARDEPVRTLCLPASPRSVLPVVGRGGTEVCAVLLRDAPIDESIDLADRLRPPSPFPPLGEKTILVEGRTRGAAREASGTQGNLEVTGFPAPEAWLAGERPRGLGPPEPLHAPTALEYFRLWLEGIPGDLGDVRYLAVPHAATPQDDALPSPEKKTSDSTPRGVSSLPEKLALLIGCTEYPHCTRIPELWGPANDVELYVRVLTDPARGFGVAAEDVVRLVDWPEDPRGRPTQENIAAAMERLIERAAEGTQVFILFSGHGVQVPVPEGRDLFDPSNPEPDGMDEVFLPADVSGWGPGGLDRAVTDDQISAWLDRLREKGADVWVVFDCCHSGQMNRGEADLERSRAVATRDLGVPESLLESAAERARRAAAKRGGTAGAPVREKSPFAVNSGAPGRGKLAVFFAAQNWEETPELPRPNDAPRTRENYYGLLSYVLLGCLQEVERPISYRDLGRRIVARYRAERGARGPTPSLAGDLDREVLGMRTWRAGKITLRRDGRRLTVSSGALAGLGPGSVLAVRSPRGVNRDPERVLGHVQVLRVQTFSAEVEPCAFGGRPAVDAEQLPSLGRCEVVDYRVGDLQLTLAVATPPSDATKEETAAAGAIRAALEGLSPEFRARLAVLSSGHEAEAEWVLHALSPRRAERRFGLKLDRISAVLLPGGGRGATTHAAHGTRRRHYDVESADALADELERDLAKVFTWQALWKLAAQSGGEASDSLGLVLEVMALEKLEGPARPLTETAIEPGQILEYRIRNDGPQDLWIGAFYLDADFGIDWYTADAPSLRAGKALPPIPVRITGDPAGVEGIVVLALPMAVHREQPPLGHLAQPAWRAAPAVTRGDAGPGGAAFESLMEIAGLGRKARGAAAGSTPGPPAVVARSWTVLPAPAD